MTFKHFFKLALLPLTISQAFAAQATEQSSTTAQESPSLVSRFMNDDNPFRINFDLGDHPSYFQVYGLVDIGLTHINHSLPENYELANNFYPYAGAKKTSRVTSRTNWVNGGWQGSRLGFKGEVAKLQAWDHDFKFIYQFEAGFNTLDMRLHDAAQTLADNSGTNANSSVSANSSMNGELFTRQAWAGIDGGSWGKLTYGTQYNPFFEITVTYDPNGKADSFSPLGESGTVGGGGGVSENSRMKNSLKYANVYELESHDKINYAVINQFGNSAGTAHGNGYTTQLGYESSAFGVQLAYDRFFDSVKSGTAAAGNPLANDTIAVSLYNTQAVLLTGRWMPTKDLKIIGGAEWYQLQPSSSPSIGYNSIYDQTVFGGVATSALKPGYKQDNYVYYLGANFDFAQRAPALAGLTASFGYYLTKSDAIEGPTVSTNSQAKIDTWTAMVDYKINKRFDTYLAYTTNHFSGDKYPSATNYTNVTSYGAGLRMKF